MKKCLILSILFLILIPSCCSPKSKRPFVIVSKAPHQVLHDEIIFFYQYEDSLGTLRDFYDKNIYQIGDTL